MGNDTWARHHISPGLWLYRAAGRWPGRTALIHGDRQLSYETLNQRVVELAASVMQTGSAPFAVLSRQALRIAWATWLALHLGQPLLPLDPRRRYHVDLLRACGLNRAFADPEIPLPDFVHRQDSRRLEAAPGFARSAPRPAAPDAIQLLIATSGSTGLPRAAMLSAANLETAVRASRQRVGLQAGDLWLNCLPLYHIAGISILLRCLEAGATVVLHDQFDAATVWKTLIEREATHVSLVPAMLARLLAKAGDHPPPPSLRVVLVGGGPLSAELFRSARETGWPLCPTYGLSENASQVATLCPAGTDWQPGDVGKPLAGVQVRIIDTEGRPTRGTGVIRIDGPTVMAGYGNEHWRRGDGLDRGGFVTGDLGHMDERGHIHVIGRADDVVVTGGENIHPREVEEVLLGCAGIEEVAIVGRPDPSWGQVLLAFVVGDITESEFSTCCEGRLSGPLRPREMIQVSELPRDRLGKIDRRRLQDWAAKRG